ncbi:MAG: M23 family metallopeptidase [Clostridia bacterium]|nr:M23 family metallopeptidase [Clostridia bacterium]
MKYYNYKSKNAFSSKSFYLAVAISILAIGGAIWSMWSSVDNETIENEPSSDISYYSPITENSSEAEVQGEASEPYEVESSSQEATSSEETSPVATSFAMPLKGDIAKSFSDSELKFSNTYKDMRYHEGIDLNCDQGSSVKSPGKGTVVAVINDSLLGVYIEIDHGNGIVSRCSGLNKNVLVSEGDIVNLGDKLGITDIVPSECVDAPHLHFELFKDGKSIDPLSIIK